MESFSSDAVVIGAGAVGLAIARQFARAGHDVVILEKNAHFGMETSARNSEVIHAGIYYPKGSLKARLCARGKALLYEFCATHGVPHKRIGKLIVGQAGQEAQRTLEGADHAEVEKNGKAGEHGQRERRQRRPPPFMQAEQQEQEEEPEMGLQQQEEEPGPNPLFTMVMQPMQHQREAEQHERAGLADMQRNPGRIG